MVYSIPYSSWQVSHIPLRLVYFGFRHEMERSNYPNGAGFVMWYYCLEGKGEFKMNGKRILFQPGQCMMLMPDTPYSCKPLTENCACHLLGFTGPCCLELLHVTGVETSDIYQIPDADIFPDYMERFALLHSQDASQDAYSRLCYAMFIDVCPHVERVSEIQPEAQANDLIRIVIDYLESHYQEPVSLDILADTVHLTKEYLCTLFKKETGHTILGYLTLIRIGWARRYLERYPDKKAYEIGQMCGFDSPSYFSRKFREIVGVTPDSYRRVRSVSL